MTTRECMEKGIARLKEQIAEAISRGAFKEAAQLQEELSHEQEGLDILLEGREDIDIDESYDSDDPIQNYLHKKMRF